ncbi:hypothetical protein FACS189468_5920 [Spirochaetia bacterium]|nr:hypothetical protein FACS189468_5920 [Spirochaetia bacterium]
MDSVLPFSLFQRSNRPYYYVRFRNEITGKLSNDFLNTQKETEFEALQVAFHWLRDGIPTKQQRIISGSSYDLRTAIQEANLTREDASFIIDTLKQKGFIKAVVFNDSTSNIDFNEYLINFWTFGKSDYLSEKLRKENSIHRRHVENQLASVKKYWCPAFKGKFLGELVNKDIKEFVKTFDTVEKAVTTKNAILLAGLTALRYAYKEDLIQIDITKGIVKFSGESKKRNILTPELVKEVFKVEWADERTLLANKLAMITGMRAGEIQALRIKDLNEDSISVKHSWNYKDGLKPPKNNDTRIVEIPFKEILESLRALSEKSPHHTNDDSFVFWSRESDYKPMEAPLFLNGLRAALKKVKISKEKNGLIEDAKAIRPEIYTFHSWRHFFTSYMRRKLDQKLLQSQTGHKTLEMLDHYSDHILDGDKAEIQKAALETFESLLN